MVVSACLPAWIGSTVTGATKGFGFGTRWSASGAFLGRRSCSNVSQDAHPGRLQMDSFKPRMPHLQDLDMNAKEEDTNLTISFSCL